MSITTGIEICKRDKKGKYVTDVHNNRWMSWKNEYVNFWIHEYFFTYTDELIPIKGDPDYIIRFIVPKEIMIQFSNDLIAKNFRVCPDAYEFIEDTYSNELAPEEEKLISYGIQAKHLCELIKDDEYFVYYWID